MRTGNRPTRERQRLDFAKIKTTVQIPNLIDVQKKSYQRFLQMSQGENPNQEWQAQQRIKTLEREIHNK